MPRLVQTTVGTLIDPVDLESMIESLAGTRAQVDTVPYTELDPCSECPEDDGPGRSVAFVRYVRFGFSYREPVCGTGCAEQKVRALAAGVTRADDIRVFVLQLPEGATVPAAPVAVADPGSFQSVIDMGAPTKVNPAWQVSHVTTRCGAVDEISIKADLLLDVRDDDDMAELLKLRDAINTAWAHRQIPGAA